MTPSCARAGFVFLCGIADVLRAKKYRKILKWAVAIREVLRHHMRCSNGGKASARDDGKNQNERNDKMANDRFFTTRTCDRCGRPLDGARIMSMFNEQTICMDCSAKERERPDYKAACDAEITAVRAGDRNFKGIGL